MTDPTLGKKIHDLTRAEKQSPVRINFGTWTAYDRIQHVAHEPRDWIRRQDLIDCANRTWASSHDESDESVEHLFALTMMWGSGTRNGRGPRNTNAALRSNKVAVTLRDARTLLETGDIPAAYYLHGRLPGVGPAFFTKLLWVIGRTTDVHPTPLILDSYVWTALRNIGWSSRDAACSVLWGRRYFAYLNACDQWATDGYTPEDVEYTLFKSGRDTATA